MKIQYKRIAELDYFNVIACLAVILIHVLGIGIAELDPKSFQMAVIYIPWRLSQFVVPAFLFSGAAKMSLSFNSSFELSYGKYVIERCRNILLPYMIFSVIYYVVFIKIGYIKGSFSELFSGIITGGISGHFYYIIVVMQFYLLRPVWKKIVYCIPWYISVLCAALFSFFTAKAGYVLQLFDINFIYTDKVFLLYIYFWIAGLYAGRYYERLYGSLKVTVELFTLRASLC